MGYKLGAWHDVAWLDLRLGEDRGEPPEAPRMMPDLIDLPAWREALRAGIARLR